ncbi:MAG TPA: DNA methyltransferase [Patescibacteria group bacterium]|nr:DNA methyltransferase [Patescibacteria group bacterium]
MTPKSIFILGRQPAIGRAELESVLGAEHLITIGDQAVGCDIDPASIPFDRLGGSIRVAQVLHRLNTNQWSDIVRYLVRILPEYLAELPSEGKLKLGLSMFGLSVSPQQLFRTGLDLKKVCKANSRSVRLVPNTEAALSSAQVLHNQLAGDVGMELLFIQDRNSTWLARTTDVQNINAYAARDQHRPKRDARVGMLPPKLAQTIVNLATGPLGPQPEHTVLDPFCGTGVVLQEAALMGYGSYGTDLEPRMIDYTRENLAWLARAHDITLPTLSAGDATTFHWDAEFSVVASETYLGRPLSGWPNPEKLREIIGTCNVILEKFLTNMATQTPANLRLCLAVPAWKAPNGRIHHLPLLDRLEDLGYNRVSFEHAETQELVYSRPEQLVARELLVIIRK